MRTSLLFLLLATHSLASVSSETSVDSQELADIGLGLGYTLSLERPNKKTYKIHPMLHYTGKINNIANYGLEFKTWPESSPPTTVWVLSANLGKKTPAKKGPISVETRGTVTLQTTPLVNYRGTEIGRQWSGCVPGQGFLTQNDELFLTRDNKGLRFEDPKYEVDVAVKFHFQKQFSIGPSYFTFLDRFGNHVYYNLVTPNTKHMRISSQIFRGIQSLKFIPVDCGCPETANPSCVIHFDGHDTVLLKPSTAYHVVYRGPGEATVRFQEYVPELEEVKTPNTASVERQTVSLTLFVIIAVGCFLF